MNKMWVDVPSGWVYGFPKLYNPEEDGELAEWVYNNGYPRDKEILYHRMWEATDQNRDEYNDRADD